VVWARNKEEAIIELDQVGNAEGCPLLPLREFQLHLQLTDEGTLEYEALGEGSKERFLSLAYPVLEKTLHELYAEMEDDQETFTAEQQARIHAAVEQERQRVKLKREEIPAPETEMGSDIQRQTGMATRLVNRIVKDRAHQKPGIALPAG
jgi:hypothetical protein